MFLLYWKPWCLIKGHKHRFSSLNEAHFSSISLGGPFIKDVTNQEGGGVFLKEDFTNTTKGEGVENLKKIDDVR